MAEQQQLMLVVSSLFIAIIGSTLVSSAEGNWCVARSDASYQALQTALDYACWSGADCTPIQPNGLCYLPNTIQAHASYAFNSFFQRKAMAAGSCDFSGTATVAKTDPSYGSCVYPSSASTAGGIAAPSTPTTAANNPNVLTPPGTTTPMYGGGTAGGFNPGMTPPLPPDNSKAHTAAFIAKPFLMPISFLFLLLLSFY
ncbi:PLASMODESMATA CALLOSE-BINDING PROTEIN 3 [Tripterygium wilfordii]|uniref:PLASMODESMATA CALLOSE-BINDING PROTEIN 3 n=1 Tax=Tripterygium wilfordii TaxID=458696 RepID=A0A7J7CRD1_TRIWF|nr:PLASMODESMATA CALLOSE-BINDING PROTEIN 3-like [Tripterygium wilfordii]KAF5736640.1 PLASMODESMATA CALLOSE-BINDING PROTEIN 3 [Tripterygium wilfordii]